MSSKAIFTEEGVFSTGCNYWASHAGTNMWHDWRPEVVEADFKQLSEEAGLQVVRLFPIWPDFQPLSMHFGGCGTKHELRMGEAPLGHDELGRAGVDKTMMERFSFVVDAAERHNLKLIVGLITGWMSGRLFVPPAFANVNVLKDPSAIKWQIKFVRAFVRHFKERKAIAAWEYGNECNCMGFLDSTDEAYLWSSAIRDAVHSEDPSRPFVAGMHSVEVAKKRGNWLIEDQGEICDVLTTHPYPLFTPFCALDPIDELRSGSHAAAESRLYADVGGKPCIVEEVGTLGPATCSDEVASRYARMSLFMSLANDCRAFLWWCGYDQDLLEHTPYEWTGVERQLGLFRNDRAPKPIVESFKEIRAFAKAIPKLPLRSTEAVCILSRGQDCWGVAFASFMLAKQAGFDIEFQKAGQPLKSSKLYLLPSLDGSETLHRSEWKELLAKVSAGAELYMSFDNPMVAPFEEFSGIRVRRRSARNGEIRFSLDFAKGVEFSCASPSRFELEPVGAEVLGRESDGNPCFSSFKLGKGKVHFLSAPVEKALVEKPGAFHGANAQPFWKIYAHLAKSAAAGRAIDKGEASQLAVTEHCESDKARFATLINCSSQGGDFKLQLRSGWKLVETAWGEKASASKGSLSVKLPPNGVSVLRLAR